MAMLIATCIAENGAVMVSIMLRSALHVRIICKAVVLSLWVHGMPLQMSLLKTLLLQSSWHVFVFFVFV